MFEEEENLLLLLLLLLLLALLLFHLSVNVSISTPDLTKHILLCKAFRWNEP